MRCGPVGLAAALAFTVAPAFVYGKDSNMPSPPSAMAPDEQPLDGSQVAQLDCLDVERRKLVASHGGVLDSESVSRCAVFGYIFRYRVERPFVDEIDGPYTAHSTLVLWTTNCKTFSGATYPGFELPKIYPK